MTKRKSRRLVQTTAHQATPNCQNTFVTLCHRYKVHNPISKISKLWPSDRPDGAVLDLGNHFDNCNLEL